jgi:hypothetical protein
VYGNIIENVLIQIFMRKTLYLHIGHFKTGTTALQVFMKSNPRFLAKNDIAYAEARRNLSKHSALAFSLYRAAGVKDLMHGYNNPLPPEQMWQDLFDEVRKSPQSRFVVSSEEFMRLGNFPKAAALLGQIAKSAEDIDIRVIAYLRAPNSHLRSWYNQLVKMGKRIPKFNAAVTEVFEPVHYDYALALRPWVTIFGADAVILRPYCEAHRDDGGLFRDFLSIYGVKLPDWRIQLPLRDPNPRIDDNLVELTRLMQNAKMPDELMRRTLTRSKSYLQTNLSDESHSETDALCDIRRKAQMGINELAEQFPEYSNDLAHLRAHLPKGDDPEANNGWRMTEFLLNELQSLRSHMRQQNAKTRARIKALEGALSEKDPSQK